MTSALTRRAAFAASAAAALAAPPTTSATVPTGSVAAAQAVPAPLSAGLALPGMVTCTCVMQGRPDAALLAMVAEHDRIEDIADAMSDAWMDTPGGCPEEALEEIRAVSEPSQALRRRIALTPAHTLAGMAAKAGVALRYLAPGETSVTNAESDDADAVSVLLDLRRLAGFAA